MQNNRPHSRMEEVMQNVEGAPSRIGFMVPVTKIIRYFKRTNKEDNIMKKIISLFAVAVLLCFMAALEPTEDNRIDWIIPSAHAEDAVPAAEPAEEAPTVNLVPTVTTIQGNAIWLMKEAAIAEGPAYDLAKLYNLVSLQAQIATINKEGAGTYVGIAATAKITDIITKLGGNPSDMLLTFNPGVGFTGGYKTSGKKIDGGIVVNVVNLDLSKLAEFLGL